MKSCLIVDDTRTIRMVVKGMVSSFGFKPEEAGDGAQALTACQRHFPDVILLDWNMPVMNGLEFLKHLRALPGGSAPVVIFCTTETGLKHIQDGLEAGANEYIMKPFDEDILRDKFAQVGLL
jgi:two-component system, chemotaxis family, chemotaxis protein CheY